MEYTRKQFRFFCKGLALNRAPDALEAGQFPILTNCRAKDDGILESRPGMAAKYTTILASAIHSLARLNDDVGPTLATPLQAYTYIIGSGTKLNTDNSAHNALAEVDSGYSGDPLSISIHRPEQSPEPWAYIFDSSRNRKVRVDGTNYGVGIAPPNKPPSVTLGAPATKTIDDFEAGTFGGWAGAGAAFGALTNPDRVAAVAISQILFDAGNTGWASVNPASIADILPGMFLTTSANAETVLVFSVAKAVTSTTIGSIKYDSGTSGLCTIQLAGPTAELQSNAMLRNTTRTENIRVISVTYGPDGLPSIRCTTSATFAATDTITGLDSFRAYFSNNHTTAETLSTKYIQFTVTATGITYITRTVALDLSLIGSRPVLPDDEIVISLQVDLPNLVTGIQIQADCDRATNDFTRNYFWTEFRPSDLTPAVRQTLPLIQVQQQISQREPLDFAIRGGGVITDIVSQDDSFIADPTGDTQTVSGASQWTVFRVKVKDFQRTGSDLARGWKDVQTLRISVNVTGAVTVRADAWHVEGSHTLDTSEGSPYFYRQRFRNRETGAPSPWGPPIRTGVEPHRQTVVLTPETSSDAQVNLIDWIRKGGQLSDWRYVSTTPNSGTFTDDYSDASIARNPIVIENGSGEDSVIELATFDAVQPFPVTDSPRTGTCDVVGTEVTQVSGDTFNTAWFRGNIIVIDGTPYRLYSSPSSTTRLSLEENVGTKTGVTWVVSDAVMTGKQVDAVFGSYGLGERGVVFFGVKQGTLYWTAGNNPDLCRIADQLEVTSGSETLMNGCIFDGGPYVASNVKWYAVDAQGDGFVTRGLRHTTGLFARWSFCVGREGIFYLGSDARVHLWSGSEANEISGDLGNLLPKDGITGQTVNGYLPPDLTQTSKLKFDYSDGSLYFTFQDTGGNLATLRYDARTQGWFYYSYTPGVRVHYREEAKGVESLLLGGSDGKLYQSGGTADGASTIAGKVRTPCEGLGDFRDQKTFGDAVLDYSSSTALTVTPGLNQHSSTLTPITPSSASRALTSPIALNTKARDADLDIAWSSTQLVRLYGYEISGYPEPEDTTTRLTDFTDGGSPHAKWLQGARIHCDTSGQDKTVQIIGDENVVIATVTVNSSGRSWVPVSWTPAVTHLMRLNPTDADTWKLYDVSWEFNNEPDLAQNWVSQVTGFGTPNYKHFAEVELMLLSTGVVTFTLVVDGTSYDYPVASTGGIRQKVRFRLQAVKGRTIQPKIVATGSVQCRVYEKECFLFQKVWGGSGPYQPTPMFGDISYNKGAEL